MVYLESKVPKKIHIIGSVGSGKTTLAKTLSSRYSIPYYELDNVVWKRHETGDIRRTAEERDEYLKTIIHSDTWIVEGVHHTWVSPSFQRAELIVFLDTDYSIRKFRIIKRFILQKMKIEKANYKPTFNMFKKMFEWNTIFEKHSKPEILTILRVHNHKMLMLKDNKDIKKYFNQRVHF